MHALGADIRLNETQVGRLEAKVRGTIGRADMPLIDCRESGSTLRFLIPVALAAAGGAVFTGSERLGQRSLEPYFELFRQRGIWYEKAEGGFPLTVRGELKPGLFTVPGNVSSQFITGLLLALPLLNGSSEIEVIGSLESLPYVDITIGVLRQFGVAAGEVRRGGLYRVEGGQSYHAREYCIEGDWSQAAFPLLMGLLGGPVSVSGLDAGSRQGDRDIADILQEMGGDIRWETGALVTRRSELRAAVVDVSQIPDLAPAAAAAMAVALGVSRITGGKRLRDKESDRIAAIASCLNGLGADVTETEDGMVIRGRERLSGGRVSSCNDHRIAMMAASVSPACAGPVVLEGYSAVAKSWPGFWNAFRQLGGVFDEQPVG